MQDDDESGDEAAYELRSFGRRRGRKFNARQQRLLDELLPKLKTPLDRPASEAPIFTGGRIVWLEIGFGGGEHLVAQATAHPDVSFIACEPFLDGVVKVLTQIEETSLENISIHDDDARDVLRWLPAQSISRAFVLFPDPWPKTRHRKRRLVSGPTLQLLARVMQPGSELRVATDIGDYARTILQAIAAQSEFEWTATCAADWRIEGDDWPVTRYQQKAIREGRCSYFFRFRRT